MFEAKQYDDWNHTAVIRTDILNSHRDPKRKPMPWKVEELHLIEQQRRKKAVQYVELSEVAKVFVKNTTRKDKRPK